MKTENLSAREVDAMVAEKVMGWVWKRFYRWGEPDETRTLVDPMDNWLTAPQYVICDLSVRRERNLDTRFHGPKFSTDASADYTVVEHVRKTWAQDRLCRLEDYFHSCQHGRLWQLMELRGWSRWNDISRCNCVYVPGDWSQCALLVLMEESGEKNTTIFHRDLNGNAVVEAAQSVTK